MPDLTIAEEPESLQSTNPHFCKQLVSLATTHHVEASEDVYSTKGMKLISKGTRISDTLYDRVVSHKLSKPLESSIGVESAIGPDEIAQAAENALDASASLRKLAGGKISGETPVALLKRIRLNSTVNTLLNVHQSRNPALLKHCAEVTLLALGFLKKLQMADEDFVRAMVLAGMLHDIGEVYIDPDLFNRSGQELKPTEWKQIAVHPVIGDALLRRIDGLLPLVPALILEHHERMDGFGYPRGRHGEQISLGGQVLAAAEVISGLLAKQTRPLAHAELAMKLIPGEYNRSIIDLIAKARDAEDVDDANSIGTSVSATDVRQSIQELLQKLKNVHTVSDELEQNIGRFSSKARNILTEAMVRYRQVQRGLSSTGLNTDLKGADVTDLINTEDEVIRFETSCIIKEIRWRLMELSRILALQSEQLAAAEAAALSPLVSALSGKLH